MISVANVLALVSFGNTPTTLVLRLTSLNKRSSTFVERIRKRFVTEGGLEEALTERPRPGGTRKLTGKQEAYLLALASSDPPEGKKHWTMQLLADRLVELEVVHSISDETVRRTLKRGL
jgi:transposase